VQAALTGHLVFSTLHTNDAPSAVMRLMELGVPPYLLNATVLGVLAQRLIRTLCPQCKVPDDTMDRENLNLAARPWSLSGGIKPYRPVGCLDCRNTGFMGRDGLYSLLTMTEELKALVDKTPDASALRRQAVKDGMRPLRLSGLMKVAEGRSTMGEVLANTPPLDAPG
jgi:general secretion pathway protein E